MSERPSESLRVAFDGALLEAAAADPEIVLVDADFLQSEPDHPFHARFPDRFFDVRAEDPQAVLTAARLASEGRNVFARALAVHAASRGYHVVRESVCEPKANVKIVADPGRGPVSDGRTSPGMVEDLGLMRGLPGMTVLVPADAPETRAMVGRLARYRGPAYVRLDGGSLPVVTNGSFEIGKAEELHTGLDLTIIAIGRPLGVALEAARELVRVGIGVRVLDFASLKPFDEKALFRAARETGAILTLEEHSILTGLGALVASATSEEYPVPVRRMGAPDLFPQEGKPGDRDPFGLTRERCLEEAYSLLRARGKVQ